MTKSIQPHLVLITRALTQIEQYRPADRETFLSFPMVQDAILMRLQVIGENLARIRRLDAELFSDPAHNSWHKLIGLRNVISHGYESIDQAEIWKIVTEELPAFAATISAMTDER